MSTRMVCLFSKKKKSQNMERLKFDENEIPYGILSQFGLTQEMIEDLPQGPYSDILLGRRSPVLPVSITDEEGNIVKARTRFRLKGGEGGTVDVLFYPRLHRCELDCYSKQEQQALLSGKAIVSHSPEDPSVKCFVQIDPDTNQVIYVPTPVIGRNLSCMMDAFRLSAEQIRAIQAGDPVSFSEEDETVTAGIDLTEKSGIRLIVGSREQWLSERGCNEMDRFSFGIFGCWVKDSAGNLDYFAEEDYTPEILQEFQNTIARNSNLKR